MLRFVDKRFKKPEGMEIIIAEENICFNKDLWQNTHRYYKKYLSDDMTVMRLLPIIGGDGEVICYGWLDDEANRELRMLKELKTNEGALQFRDVFKEVKEVVVCGCNELAYFFVKYLETQQIKVWVTGKYWNFFGYQSATIDELCGKDILTIQAEGFLQNAEWYQRIVRSASSEFECIDKVYEVNVISSKIKDSEGDFSWLIEQLTGRYVVLIGTNAKAQDTCDLLFSKGIDIVSFVDIDSCETGRDGIRTLLGKTVLDTGYAISHMDQETIFIDCMGKGSALGTACTEKFDYYGYERNRQFFLIDDYTDVPYSNLVHLLKEKVVLLTGDAVLCQILKEYLERVEEGQIDVRHMELEHFYTDGNEIVCVVHPWCEVEQTENNLRACKLKENLKKAEGISYTTYFSYVRAFVMINEYLSRDLKKYTIGDLIPKGILLGAIPVVSGNVFVRGILDGHPDIMMLPYSDWNNNLVLYCLCLANEKAENIVGAFKNMIDSFFADSAHIFADWDKFKENLEELIALKEQFTSQELFLIFHIAYAATMNGRKIEEVSGKVIYWEPHYFNRMDFPFLARWLESPDINGNTIVMRRDGITYCGSQYKLSKQWGTIHDLPAFVLGMAIDYIITDTVSARVTCQYWKELKMRFEDLKLHPVEELSRVCGCSGLSMSDTMWRTTLNGYEWNWEGIKDFDLKPVFNKYEEYFSEFDRFRISVICSAYQKKYGYVYEDCTEFTRTELWNMFLKEFRFQRERQFRDKKERIGYFLAVYDIIRWQLWNARKHILLDDVLPEFEPIEISHGRS